MPPRSSSQSFQSELYRSDFLITTRAPLYGRLSIKRKDTSWVCSETQENMSNNPHLNPFVVPNLDPQTIDTLKTCTPSQIRKSSSTLKEIKTNRPLFLGCLSALILMCRFTSTSSKTLSKCWLLPRNTYNYQTHPLFKFSRISMPGLTSTPTYMRGLPTNKV